MTTNTNKLYSSKIYVTVSVGYSITTRSNKKATNIWQDTVPMAKLTFRIGQEQLQLYQSKTDLRQNIWAISKLVIFALPVGRYHELQPIFSIPTCQLNMF